MNIAHTIHVWLNRFSQNNSGGAPEFLPLTAEEVHEVKRNSIFYSTPCWPDDGGQTIYGMPVRETHYAVEKRARQLEVPFLHLEETTALSLEYSVRECVEKMHLHFNARVCAETTTLKVTFEGDRWAGFKRALRITRWFPVKTRTVLIDGRILYPYLKVGLPHNRHAVQFLIVP